MNYVCPVDGRRARSCSSSTRTLANNPLIFPPDDWVARLHQFRATTAEEETAWSRGVHQGDGPLAADAARRSTSGRVAPYRAAAAGPALAGRLLRLPGVPDVPVSLWTGNLDDGLPADLELGHLPGGDHRVLAVDRPLDRLRRARHDPRLRARVPARLRHRVPRRRATRTCCCSWSSRRSSRASCCARSRGRSSSPTTGSSSGRSRTIGILPEEFRLLATPAAVIAGITYNFLPFMTLPLYVALEKIDRRLIEAAEDLYAGPWRPQGTIVGGVDRRRARGWSSGVVMDYGPLVAGDPGRDRRRVRRDVAHQPGVHPGDAAARAAGHLRRVAADVHPGGRRLRQRRAAGQSRSR